MAGELRVENERTGRALYFERSGESWVSPAVAVSDDGALNRLVVSASNSAGLVRYAEVRVSLENQPVHYASPTGLHVYPFITWGTAATSIQAAVNAAASGDEVKVGEGTYGGGETMIEGLATRVAVDKAIVVEGV
ncbi:hypothetical protein RZS08_25335, partial [Arthrospira platensis SPKY1]|nr:hypothetical protein [Arthrospira platensis SPKY1]